MPTDNAHHEPYISVVVAARNDNHGGNMLGRMQAFLDSWLIQAERYDLPSEIVVVEWNSPEGARKLKDDLRWPQDTGPCDVRFVEVPREVHASIPNAASIHLHQMIAKNVGIRRARGQFVLSTNLDIIFSAELMQFLASRRLEARALYRIDRYDISNEIPGDGGMDELLAFCQSNILRVSAREGTWGTRGDGFRLPEQRDIVAPDSGIRLASGWYEIEGDDTPPKRLFSAGAEIAFQRPSTSHHLILDLDTGPSAADGWLELDVHNSTDDTLVRAIVDGRYQLRLTIPQAVASGRIRLSVRNGGIPLLTDARIQNARMFGIRWQEATAFDTTGNGWKLEVAGRRPGVDWKTHLPSRNPFAASMRNAAYLHTNGCGDFAMLSRDAWFDLRGYPEFPIWPMHLDALLCYSAYHAGFPEIVLRDPLRIFHIQHESAAGCTPDGELDLYERVARKGIPIMRYEDMLKYLIHMRRFNVPIIFSGQNWGLADASLPETGL
jgi:hypothetical protein